MPHPLSIYLSSLAGSDALVTLLVALAALVAMALANRPTWPRAILLGVLLGLGGSAKLSPLALAIVLAAAGMVLVIHGWRGSGPGARHDGRLGWRLLVQPPLAAATFIASFPYLWPDPVGRTRALLEFRAIEMYNQGVLWSELNVDGPVDALGRIGNWLGDIDSVTGQLVEVIASSFGVSWKPMELDLVLAIIGALILLVLAIQRGLGSRWAMAALVLGGQVALIVVGMRADFSRYLLPVLTATAVVRRSRRRRGLGRGVGSPRGPPGVSTGQPSTRRHWRVSRFLRDPGTRSLYAATDRRTGNHAIRDAWRPPLELRVEW